MERGKRYIKVARHSADYNKIKKMAEDYGVDKNAMFLTLLKQYEIQQDVIDNIKKSLSDEENLMTIKEYVKGRENVYANPLVRELPKHSDAANRTASAMLEVIKTLGHKKTTGSKLEGLLNDEE